MIETTLYRLFSRCCYREIVVYIALRYWAEAAKMRSLAKAVRKALAMLELRPNCECCDTDLPPSSLEARICTYECTFCATCAEARLANICPNCGGELVRRPVRPAQRLVEDPASTKRIVKLEGCYANAAA